MPFERNTTRWSKPTRNVLSVFLKEHHIDQESRNYGGGAISAIMHAPEGSDNKNKADDTVTVNKGHRAALEDNTQLLYDIIQCALYCGTLICGFR